MEIFKLSSSCHALFVSLCFILPYMSALDGGVGHCDPHSPLGPSSRSSSHLCLPSPANIRGRAPGHTRVSESELTLASTPSKSEARDHTPSSASVRCSTHPRPFPPSHFPFGESVCRLQQLKLKFPLPCEFGREYQKRPDTV